MIKDSLGLASFSDMSGLRLPEPMKHQVMKGHSN